MTTHQSLALGFFIAIGLVVGVCGEHFEVTSAQQLIKLLDISKANHFDANITLLDDLDFSDSPLTLPFGVSSDGSCVPYTGVFEGNGHTIKGLVMNNEDNQGYNKAGLFCAMENATFENLVIDSSCSFTASSAGALSVSLTGSLTATNVTNKADVSGNEGVGGFVGMISHISQEAGVTLKDCVNDGKITGRYNLGGFVGEVRNNKDFNMSFSDCINNGNLTARFGLGGFVGNIYDNTNIAMTISNCTNNGICTVTQDSVGGFIGCFQDSISMTMTISDSMNTGMITGVLFVGGLVGVFTTEPESSLNAFTIINSANKGNVSSEEYACGMFCVISDTTDNLNTTVLNSINKGSVNATTNAYGITNIITKARNVVSMGEVNASSGSFTFWNMSTDVDLFFGMDGKCVNCTDGTTLFVHKTNTGFYEVVESGEHVHDLLNAEVEKQDYGMFWTKELELVDHLVEPSPSPSSQSGGLSGGNKHGVSLFWIGVVVALAAHVAMTW